jgi:hypothetical protein
MSLSSFANLDDHDIQMVTDVVTRWCEDHQVKLIPKKGRAAMAAGLSRLLSGEKSPVALSEAINAAPCKAQR